MGGLLFLVDSPSLLPLTMSTGSYWRRPLLEDFGAARQKPLPVRGGPSEFLRAELAWEGVVFG